MGSFAASSINHGCSAPLPFLQFILGILGEVQEMVSDDFFWSLKGWGGEGGWVRDGREGSIGGRGRWWLGSNRLEGDDGVQVIWDESSILSKYSLLVGLIRCIADPYPCRVDSRGNLCCPCFIPVFVQKFKNTCRSKAARQDRAI